MRSECVLCALRYGGHISEGSAGSDVVDEEVRAKGREIVKERERERQSEGISIDRPAVYVTQIFSATHSSVK